MIKYAILILKYSSALDGAQDIIFNHSKLNVNDTLKEDEKTKTNFEPSSDPDVINKACLDTN